MIDFYLEKNGEPLELMNKNIKELEALCKSALQSDQIVTLHSPLAIEKPQNPYELTVILAEDLLKKYNEKNIIVRSL